MYYVSCVLFHDPQVTFETPAEARRRAALLLALTWDPIACSGAQLIPPHHHNKLLKAMPRSASPSIIQENTAAAAAGESTGSALGSGNAPGGGSVYEASMKTMKCWSMLKSCVSGASFDEAVEEVVAWSPLGTAVHSFISEGQTIPVSSWLTSNW